MSYKCERCNYCRFTEFGTLLEEPDDCEGRGCDEAFANWQNEELEDAYWEELD